MFCECRWFVVIFLEHFDEKKVNSIDLLEANRAEGGGKIKRYNKWSELIFSSSREG